MLRQSSTACILKHRCVLTSTNFVNYFDRYTSATTHDGLVRLLIRNVLHSGVARKGQRQHHAPGTTYKGVLNGPKTKKFLDIYGNCAPGVSKAHYVTGGTQIKSKE